MPIQVLIERLANNGYRATSGEPLAVSVEAPTRAEALAKLEKRLRARLRNGAGLVAVEPATDPRNDNPWVRFAGMFKNSPMFDEVVEIMAENRRNEDNGTDGP